MGLLSGARAAEQAFAEGRGPDPATNCTIIIWLRRVCPRRICRRWARRRPVPSADTALTSQLPNASRDRNRMTSVRTGNPLTAVGPALVAGARVQRHETPIGDWPFAPSQENWQFLERGRASGPGAGARHASWRWRTRVESQVRSPVQSTRPRPPDPSPCPPAECLVRCTTSRKLPGNRSRAAGQDTGTRARDPAGRPAARRESIGHDGDRRRPVLRS